jgi:ArsR family transcriptional regulator, arsenate/arsenite/antimonite-responsive transcriptional repressor
MPIPKATSRAVDPTARYADMLAALGTDHRLRILRLLLSAHPDGMVVGEIQAEIGIPPSTLSHHLERLKAEGLVTVRRESTFLRYLANTAVLEELLGFLFSECCRRSKAVKAETVIRICGIGSKGRCS